MMRRRVVLPEPEGPRRATSFPPGASTVTLSSAVNEPKRLVMFLARMLMGRGYSYYSYRDF